MTKERFCVFGPRSTILYNSDRECDQAFGSKFVLEEHMNKFHLRISFDCDKCDDKKFPIISGLQQHLKKVHGDKRYCCDACGSSYRSVHVVEDAVLSSF